MDTPTRRFLKAVGPSLRQVSDETGIDYDFLRRLAASKGQDAGPETRRKLVEWGSKHLPEVASAFDALRATLPDAAPDPQPSTQPLPDQPAVSRPIVPVTKESQTRRKGKRGG